MYNLAEPEDVLILAHTILKFWGKSHPQRSYKNVSYQKKCIGWLTVAEMLLQAYFTVAEMLLQAYFTVAEMLLQAYWMAKKKLLNIFIVRDH